MEFFIRQQRIFFVPPCLRGVFFILFFTWGACKNTHRTITPAFYHWQTRFALQPAETAYLDSLGCHKLYVKFLDIASDPETGEIRPYSLLEVIDTTGLAGEAIVPCVFITHTVFQDISTEKLDWLVQKTASALENIGAQFAPVAFPEVQFDCDWTPASRASFFSFLEKIKPLLPPGTVLSATIRLHQYKFPDRTGVPPVDRGMLMLYNTGDIDEWEAGNSIFQPADAEKYLYGAPGRYPLRLDLALPVFSWALVYRNDELWKIVPDPNLTEFQDSTRFEALSAGRPAGNIARFRIRQNTFLSGYYLRTGDLIRVEEIATTALREAAQLAGMISLPSDVVVAFYHLDTSTVRRYPATQLKTIWKTLEQVK